MACCFPNGWQHCHSDYSKSQILNVATTSTGIQMARFATRKTIKKETNNLRVIVQLIPE